MPTSKKNKIAKAENTATAQRQDDENWAEIAAMDFEPWQHSPDEWRPPSNDEWAELANPHLITIRIAWVALHRSKPEMIETAQSLADDDMLIDTLDNLNNTSDWLKGLQAIVNGAQARLVGSALNLEEKPV